MRTSHLIAWLTIMSLSLSTIGNTFAAPPTTIPTGANTAIKTTGGFFKDYFDNLTSNPCDPTSIVNGFETVGVDYLKPKCTSLWVLMWPFFASVFATDTSKWPIAGFNATTGAPIYYTFGEVDIAGNAIINNIRNRVFSGVTMTGTTNISGPTYMSGDTYVDKLCMAGSCISNISSILGSSQWWNVTGGIAYTGANVGIGTDLPSAKVEIAWVNTNNLRLNNQSTISNYNYIEFTKWATRDHWLGAVNPSGFSIGSDIVGGDNFSFYNFSNVDVPGTLSIAGNASASNVMTTAVGWNGYCFWSDCVNYKISLVASAYYLYGPVSDYSIRSTMSNTPGRGWTWGTPWATPIAALNTAGTMQIAGSMTIWWNAIVSWIGAFGNANGATRIFYTTLRGGEISTVPALGWNGRLNLNWISGNGGTYIGNGASGLGDLFARNLNASGSIFVDGRIYVDDSICFGAGSCYNETNIWWGAGSQWTGTSPGDIYYNAAGKVGIGTATPRAKLDVNGEILATNKITLAQDTMSTTPTWHMDNSADKFRIYRQPNIVTAGEESLNINRVGAGNFDMRFYGNITANGFLYSSDRNLKKNITPLEGSLEKIMKLSGYSYNWKSTGKADIGIIAQEVETVYPDLVHTNSEGVKSVEYANLIAPLIEAVKTQQKEIEVLKAEVAGLKK